MSGGVLKIWDGTQWVVVGGSSGGGDFLPRDGSLPMLEDLDLGGNDILGLTAATRRLSSGNAFPYAADLEPPTDRDIRHKPLTRSWYTYLSSEDNWQAALNPGFMFNFGNTSPYTASTFARFGNMLCNNNHQGIVIPFASRIDKVIIASDRGLGTPPSNQCQVTFYVNGSVVTTQSWSGSSYDIDYNWNIVVASGDRFNFQYVNDALGQSAGKVIGQIYWRRLEA